MSAESDDVGGAGFDHEPPQAPSRAGVVWFRSSVVLIIGFVLAGTPWGLLRDGAGVWSSVLGVAALACLLPLAVSAWGRATRPYPHARTWLALSRGLTGPQRRSVDRALRRGRVDDIVVGHRPYARAQTARSSREVLSSPVVGGVFWGQALLAASRELGSWFFWMVLGGAVVATAFACTAIVLQRRRERTVARFGPPAGCGDREL